MKARFKIQGRQELQFWLRAFQMEFAVEHGQATVASGGPETGSAVCPIISEYQCGRWYWQLFLMPEVDALGLVGGNGVLWLTTEQKEREEQIAECAKLANDVLPKTVNQKILLSETPKER